MCFDARVSGYAVDLERCVRCASCAILAPQIFEVGRRVQISRQPETPAELRAVEAAALVCPTQAIAVIATRDAVDKSAGTDDVRTHADAGASAVLDPDRVAGATPDVDVERGRPDDVARLS